MNLRRARAQESATATTAGTALLERPRLAGAVQVHEPEEAGSPWVVRTGNGRYFRVGGDMAMLLRSLDGERSPAELAVSLGAPWTEPDVDRALGRLQTMDLLDDGGPAPVCAGWVRYVPPLTFQLTVVRPERVLGRLAPALRRLGRPPAPVLAAAVVLLGVVALAAQWDQAEVVLGQPQPLLLLLGVAGASLLASAVHELGHGAVLTYHGGRPSRLGVMLFYLAPAFFCDVSDGWRLPRRQARVAVAFAGIATQLLLAAAASLTAGVLALVGSSPSVRRGLLLFAVTTGVTALLNLVPFVKLDGYIALLSHVDVPFLREKSMTDARRFLGKLFLGGTYERALPQVGWAVPFGLVSLVFPFLLVVAALNMWSGLLQGLGVVGAVVGGLVLLVLLRVVVRGVGQVLGEARAAGAGPVRTALVGVTVAAALVAASTLVQVPYRISGGFTADGGRTLFVSADSADLGALAKGHVVHFERRGAVTSAVIGRGVVAGDRVHAAKAPLSVMLPVREGDGVEVPVRAVPVAVDAPLADRSGAAQVEAGSRPLAGWLWLHYVAPFWR